MPSKLIIALIAAGTVGAVAIAGVAVSLGKGSTKPEGGAPSAITAPGMSPAEAAVLEGLTDNVRARVEEEMNRQSPQPVSETDINPDDFGAAPDLGSDVAPTQVSSRWGVGKEKLPAPPARACVSKDELNEAMMGTGCDCSCDGYAKQVAGPASGQCDVACAIGWYVCWAPDPTGAEIDAAVLSTLDGYDDQSRAAMEPIMREQLANPEMRNGYRGGLIADSAFRWNDERMCPEE